MRPGISPTGAPVQTFVLIGHLMSWPFKICSLSCHLNHGWTRESTGGAGLLLLCGVLKSCRVQGGFLNCQVPPRI